MTARPAFELASSATSLGSQTLALSERVRDLRKSPFAADAKPPFGGPERVLAYRARYTTVIANSRRLAVDDDEVSYRDYRRGGRSRVMRPALQEFIRRFLMHVLPDGFHRIRHYEFLARGERGLNLSRVRDIERQRSARSLARAAGTADGEPTASAPDPFAHPRADDLAQSSRFRSNNVK